MDMGQPIPQSPPSNLKDGPMPAPNNIISAQSSPTIPFHAISRMIGEFELGKSLLTIGLPIAIAVLLGSKKFHTTFTYFMVSGVSIGSVAIWNGILLRTTFPRTAKVVERLGNLMVILSVSGLLGSCAIPSYVLVYLGCLLFSRLFFGYILR